MKIKTLILIIIIFAVLIITSAIYTTIPRIELNGMKNMVLSYRKTYEEPGIILKNANAKNLKKLKIENNIQNDKIGNYYVDYSLKIGGKLLKKRRNIKIIDDITPIIKLEGNQIIEISLNEEYQEPGFTAYDEYDGDLTEKVEITGEINTKKYGEQVLKYTVKDSSNNITEVNRIIKVIDEIPPKIQCNTSYSAFKIDSDNIIDCKAIDNYDGDITNKIKIIGTYNTKEKGIYKIQYEVQDDAGNKTKIDHNIIIYEQQESQIPSAYLITQYDSEIINFLEKNNILNTILNLKNISEENKNPISDKTQIGLNIKEKNFNEIKELKEYCNMKNIKYIELNKNITEKDKEQMINKLININEKKIIIINNSSNKKEFIELVQILKEMNYKFDLLNNF